MFQRLKEHTTSFKVVNPLKRGSKKGAPKEDLAVHNFKHTDWPQPSGLFQYTTKNSVKVKKKIKE